ncbi:MAG: sugar transferase [Bacteroidota bacterium]|nr:sugar transferase [Bacteroidota bacterium]
MNLYKYIGKRLFDISLSLTFLIILSIPFIVIFCLNVKKFGLKPFFIQKRTGKNLKSFYIIKFKTLNDIFDSNGKILIDELRFSTWGNFLRKYSLDEIPQLFNVIKGEMAIVGPRPLLPEYDSKYPQKYLRRFEVRPGLTGLAQTNGRNEISWDYRLQCDVDYVNNMSLWYDIQIMIKTFFQLINGKGNVKSMSMIEYFNELPEPNH